jgi:hypothetical protein
MDGARSSPWPTSKRMPGARSPAKRKSRSNMSQWATTCAAAAEDIILLFSKRAVRIRLSVSSDQKNHLDSRDRQRAEPLFAYRLRRLARARRLDGMETGNVEKGCKLPAQTHEGSAHCFCGAQIDIARWMGTSRQPTDRTCRCVTSISLPPIKARIVALLPHEPLCLATWCHCRRISRLSAPVVRNAGTERELVSDALGFAATAAHQRNQHPQCLLATLARLAEARKPLPGPIHQLRGVRAGAKP